MAWYARPACRRPSRRFWRENEAMAPPLDPIDPAWARLRRHTPARIGLARAGSGLATREHLSFQLAHARARDAVHDALEAVPLLDGLRARGLDPLHLPSPPGARRPYLLPPHLRRPPYPPSPHPLPS